ncbi:MAG: transport-associated protein [Myxococcaceae bacterium]|nr:transport-associated protein [Myxococcaceae bacterium]
MSSQPSLTDSDIQRAVQHELSADARVAETSIGVTVDRGVVELTGVVTSLAEREAAQEAAHRTAGVRDVANELRVGASSGSSRSDVEIALAVRCVLERSLASAAASVVSTVTHGWVLLEGAVESSQQSAALESSVRGLVSVCGVNNELTVKTAEASVSEAPPTV